jgi:hypothetical protein
MKSADCIALLVQTQGGSSKDWKRLSKRKEGLNVVRVFQNRDTGNTHTIIEEPSGFLRLIAGNVVAKGFTVTLVSNPVAVDFKAIAKWKHFSGRVIYERNRDGEEKGEVHFFCGRETSDGWMDDTGDGPVDDLLRRLFSDFGDAIDIGAAESYHTAGPIPGVKAHDLWAIIKVRLERSGCVPMKKH